jgi:cell division protein FtsI/penicillin-binding protein 2
MNNSRALIIVVIIFLFFTALVVKLVDVQIIKSEELRYYAKRQQTKMETVPAERGLIYDRNGVLLVHNRNDVTIYIDLRMLPESKKEDVADKFSEIFGKSKKHYMNLLKQSGKTICIEKKAPFEKARLLSEYKMDAIVVTEDPTRVYQYGSLASHLLGYVNDEHKGVNGIAKAFNDELDGENGARLVERNALGDLITISEKETIHPIPGNNIVLTIDKTIQTVLEEGLRAGLKKYRGKSATGIIMNPNNGEILALANVEDYDPNLYWKFNDFRRKNRAVTDTYEPGSTFKAITIAALLNEKACFENEIVNVENGTYKFRNSFIRDTHPADRLSVKGVIEESSNIGIAKLVQRLNDETFYKYVRDFGFGNYTSITLPGEVKGTLKNPGEWSKLSKTYMSFGYGLAVTPIQLATAFSALVNGGVLYKPQLVKKQTNWQGKKIYEAEPVAIRKVISSETSERVRSILKSAVAKGTGKSARSELISVGGKTGTSKIAKDGGYASGKYNSSFIGFFPAENPQVVCLILIDSPELEKYGSKVAAPIFKNITESIVSSKPGYFFNYDNYIPDESDEIEETKTQLIFSDNINVKNQEPFSLAANIELTDNRMPDLRGMTIKEALIILNKIGLKYTIKGNGFVNNQSIKPGDKINKNKICILNCSASEIKGARVY